MTSLAPQPSHFRRGVTWLGSATVLARLSNIASLVFVLRHLDKGALGAASVVISLTMAVEAFASLGVQTSLVRQAHDRAAESSLFWLSAISGTGLCLLMWLLAPVAAWWFDAGALVALLQVSACKPLLIALSAIPLHQALRSLDYRKYALLHLLAGLAEDLTKAALAIAGWGAWSLVLAGVMRGAALLGLCLLFARFVPRPRLAWAEVRPHLSFGLPSALGVGIGHLAKDIDFLVVGHFGGLTAVGLYRFAFEFVVTPVEIMLRAVTRASYPILCRVRHDRAQLAQETARLFRTVLLLAGVILVVVLLLQAPLTAWLGGGKWQGAQPIVWALCLGSLWRTLEVALRELYNALGRPMWVTAQVTALLAVLAAALTLAFVLSPPAQALRVAACTWSVVACLFAAVALSITRKLVDGPRGALRRAILEPLAVLAMAAPLPLFLHFSGHWQAWLVPAQTWGTLAAQLGLVVLFSVLAWGGHQALWRRPRLRHGRKRV
ncbi:MAG: oligosaccharide flippase family protein [Polyangiales bacterium]